MLEFPGSRVIEGRVLLVEENAESADVISECLTRAGAEIVGPVSTPTAARQLLKRERVDAVLFDANQGSEDDTCLLAAELDSRRVPSMMLNGDPVPSASSLHEGRPEMLWPFSEAALQAMVCQLVLAARRGLPPPL